jgi:hypothetical protein
MPANARLRSSGFVVWEYFFFVFVASGALRECNATPQSSVGPWVTNACPKYQVAGNISEYQSANEPKVVIR